ncbi:MAG: Tryptophan synthase alpha chain [Methanoregulaceae archaeon PtaB.Bin009]|nr:MAG: Tryptophan synthase alpha chain [Methanoregulaceae archaeon PtaB.Bin009]OPY42119.1 MAG: Tryptophan synthase alpha chain [Methanoregulaceae archaeon PtaU1.Bin066]HNQ29065.1 tryptophan synthase subunit alpha [Methanolinea sp.]
MTTRIVRAFSARTRPLLVACLVAGDPDYGESLAMMREVDRAGADIIEVVMPFSDPVADGPVMQQAIQRALSAGMNTDSLFSLIRDFRAESETPLVVLTYANPVVQRGIGAFYRDAGGAGVDGVAVADVPLEEADSFCRAARKAGVDPILFVSQTTSMERLKGITAKAGGFLYLVAALGVTGMRGEVDPATIGCIRKIKEMSSLPVVPGFGISSPGQVQAYSRAGADGIIVGSAIVREVGDRLGRPGEMRAAVGEMVRSLVAGMA